MHVAHACILYVEMHVSVQVLGDDAEVEQTGDYETLPDTTETSENGKEDGDLLSQDYEDDKEVAQDPAAPQTNATETLAQEGDDDRTTAGGNSSRLIDLPGSESNTMPQSEPNQSTSASNNTQIIIICVAIAAAILILGVITLFVLRRRGLKKSGQKPTPAHHINQGAMYPSSPMQGAAGSLHSPYIRSTPASLHHDRHHHPSGPRSGAHHDFEPARTAA